MAWVKLDDHFSDHPKAKAAGPIGRCIQVAAFCYASKYLSNGFINFSAAAAIINSEISNWTDSSGKIWTASFTSGMGGVDANEINWEEVMVESGLWDLVEGGYQIHDYLDYNYSKEEVETLRETRSQAGRRGGSQSKLKPKPSANGQANAKQTLKQNESKSEADTHTHTHTKEDVIFLTKNNPPNPPNRGTPEKTEKPKSRKPKNQIEYVNIANYPKLQAFAQNWNQIDGVAKLQFQNGIALGIAELYEVRSKEPYWDEEKIIATAKSVDWESRSPVNGKRFKPGIPWLMHKYQDQTEANYVNFLSRNEKIDDGYV